MKTDRQKDILKGRQRDLQTQIDRQTEGGVKEGVIVHIVETQ